MKLSDKITRAGIFGPRAIKAHKAEYMGVNAADYFPGATAHGTKYDEVFTGIGETPQEAYQDACEQAAEMYDTAYLPATARMGANGETVASYLQDAGISDEEAAESEMYCYVLLYVQNAY